MTDDNAIAGAFGGHDVRTIRSNAPERARADGGFALVGHEEDRPVLDGLSLVSDLAGDLHEVQAVAGSAAGHPCDRGRQKHGTTASADRSIHDQTEPSRFEEEWE